MSYSPKKTIVHSHLIQQPSFKHSLIAALVISLGGTSLATWAGDNVTPMTTQSSATAPAPFNFANCDGKYEQHQQNRTERRTEAFQQADRNKDSKVTLTEWLAFKPHHHGKADGQNRDHHQRGGKNPVEWLLKVDANKDGQISKAEAESSAPRLAKHFAKIDANHNSLISPDELKASHDARKAKWQERSIEKRTKAFEKADSNHDGQLTQAEWLAFKPQHHGFWHSLWKRWFGGNDTHQRHEQHQGQRGNLYKKVDTNNDQQISLSEAQTNAPRLAEHFNEVDTNRDGQISQDERRTAFKAACAKSQS
jgi:Ca2+-binding EF-hand superfamily protein